jgi:hypothetical protein
MFSAATRGFMRMKFSRLVRCQLQPVSHQPERCFGAGSARRFLDTRPSTTTLAASDCQGVFGQSPEDLRLLDWRETRTT